MDHLRRIFSPLVSVRNCMWALRVRCASYTPSNAPGTNYKPRTRAPEWSQWDPNVGRLGDRMSGGGRDSWSNRGSGGSWSGHDNDGLGHRGSLGFQARGRTNTMTSKQRSLFTELDARLSTPNWSAFKLVPVQRASLQPHPITTQRPPVRCFFATPAFLPSYVGLYCSCIELY